MSYFFDLVSIILACAALIGYLNYRFWHLPATTAINAGALTLSLLLLIGIEIGFQDIEVQAQQWLNTLNLHDLLLDGMLSLLLFAGGLTINVGYLKQCRYEIALLAFGATIASTLLIGGVFYLLFQWLNISFPFLYALLFGALISPTDPIAVLAIFKEMNAPKKLEVMVAGESLFNDGVGIVLFLTLYQLTFTTHQAEWTDILVLFIQQAIGGLAYGIALGWIGYKFLRNVQEAKLTILMTLAIASGGYVLAKYLGVSGPLAMVTAGIFISNHRKLFSKPENLKQTVTDFWEISDEILNAILFFLIGLEVLVLDLHANDVTAALLAIPLVLIIRWITVCGCIMPFKFKRKYDPHIIKILTWGGLRGGLAIALALSLPPNAYRHLILSMTYAIVIFAIVVQGLTIKPLTQLSSSKKNNRRRR